MKYRLVLLSLMLGAMTNAGEIKCFRFAAGNQIKINIDKDHRDGHICVDGKTIKLLCTGDPPSNITCKGARSAISYVVEINEPRIPTSQHFLGNIKRTDHLAGIEIDLGAISCFELR